MQRNARRQGRVRGTRNVGRVTPTDRARVAAMPRKSWNRTSVSPARTRRPRHNSPARWSARRCPYRPTRAGLPRPPVELAAQRGHRERWQRHDPSPRLTSATVPSHRVAHQPTVGLLARSAGLGRVRLRGPEPGDDLVRRVPRPVPSGPPSVLITDEDRPAPEIADRLAVPPPRGRDDA